MIHRWCQEHEGYAYLIYKYWAILYNGLVYPWFLGVVGVTWLGHEGVCALTSLQCAVMCLSWVFYMFIMNPLCLCCKFIMCCHSLLHQLLASRVSHVSVRHPSRVCHSSIWKLPHVHSEFVIYFRGPPCLCYTFPMKSWWISCIHHESWILHVQHGGKDGSEIVTVA